MKLTKKQKKHLYKIIGAGVCFAGGIAVKAFTGLDFGAFKPLMLIPAALFAAAYLLVGLEVLIKAVKGIFHGELLDENFLMAIATVGAIALGDLSEGVAVMLFYQIGELFQSVAVSNSRKSITSLVELRADHASVERDGEVVSVDLKIGEIIVVKPGERIPLDCEVVEGTSSLDTSALTGESLPRELAVGDTALAGCVNREGLFRARVTKLAGESTAARILDLVENASGKKSRYENFITRFARVYTPCVVAAARRATAEMGESVHFRVEHGELHEVADAGTFLPCHFLSVRAGYQRSARVLRWHRRGVEEGHTCQGRKLPRGALRRLRDCLR